MSKESSSICPRHGSPQPCNACAEEAAREAEAQAAKESRQRSDTLAKQLEEKTALNNPQGNKSNGHGNDRPNPSK